jgi:hypothetical protein
LPVLPEQVSLPEKPGNLPDIVAAWKNRRLRLVGENSWIAREATACAELHVSADEGPSQVFPKAIDVFEAR